MEAQILSSTLGAMGPVLAKLHQLYSSEYHLPKSLPSGYQIKDLKTIVEDIHKFLVRHSSVEAPRAMAKLWMNEVRELSYDMEDFIDRTAQRPFEVEEFKNLIDQARDACTRFHRYVDGRDNDMPQPSIPHDSSFGNTERSDEIEECSSSMVNGQGHVPRFIGEATYLDGMPDFRKKLISRLRDGDDAEKGKKVISIHGPAGVGKTALAKELYREIGREFKYRVFVRASQTPDTRRLLGSMISQVQRHERLLYAYSVQDLIGNLRGHLQHNRYFIVIDGLWETRSWDIVSRAFPEGSHCSRILVTTDIKEVALECCGYESDGIFEMEPLQIDHSKHLFFKRVFGSSEQECPQHLSKISQEIISSCDGLPLAVILISGILACEQENLELWNRVKDCLFSSIKKNQSQQDFLREIVLLCYNNLSRHLRTCLLYLNLYPEGYAFLKADLVKQWNAEGFTSAAEKNGTNQKAEDYFHELVCRGLIQPYHFKFSDEVMFYTVHSIVFEFVRNKSIEENFTTVIDYSNTITQLSAKARRLSLTFSNSKYAKKPEGITLTQVRSLNFYGFVECLPSLTKFEALRILVLDLWGSLKELDLSFIDTLFQLRYIHITTNTDVKLPAKMRGLRNLETLEIYATVASVPSDIVYLSSLLHLCLHGEINLSDGTGYMKSLRTLQYFDLSSNSEDNIRRLGQMRDLQDLHLTCSTEMPGLLERKLIALASSLGNNYQLKSLVLAPGASCTSIFVDCSSRVCSLPVLLQKLELLPPICIFPRLPSWIGQIEKLCILKFVVRELTRDDTKRITGLKKLTILSLYVRKPIAESIIFSRTEFPALKHFKLRCGILRLDFQKETMPNLQSLSLTFNAHTGEKYGDMIAGIENLLNLQEIVVRVGTAPGAEESDRMAAESFCKDTIRKHSKAPNFSVRRANSVEEEIVQFRSPAASSSRSGFMPNPIVSDVIREANEIVMDHDNEPRVVTSDRVLQTSKMASTGTDARAFQRLVEAAASGHAAEMKHLALHDPDILHRTTPQGNTCLHIASSIHGREAFCRDVLALSHSLPLLSAVNADGETPLLTAVISGHSSLASFLLSRCSVQQLSETILKQDKHKCNALHHAIRYGHRELTLELIEAEPVLSHAVNQYNESPMFIAVMRDYADVFKKLLEIPGSAHGGACGYNALHAAVKNGNLYIAGRIMEIRPELAREEDQNKNTPMRLAAIWGKPDVLKELLKHDRSLGYEVSTGGPLLISAASQGNTDIARELLTYCPDAANCRPDGSTCLHKAVGSEHTEFVEFVLGSPQLARLVNMRDSNGNTPLHLAVNKCNPKMVALLLRRHTDVSVYNNHCNSAKWMLPDNHAKTLNWNEVIMLLLKADPQNAHSTLMLYKNVKNRVTQSSRKDIKSLTQIYTGNTSLVAILVATITFAAAFTLPGGYSADTGNEGLPIMARKFAFKAFLISDTLAMCSSLAVAFICIIARWEDLEFLLYYRSFTKKLMWFAYMATTTAFATGLYTVLAPHLLWLAIVICVVTSLLPILTYLLGEWPILKLRFRLRRTFKREILDMV